MGEDRTDAHSVGRDSDRLTIAEAATLLGVHKNTVRNRIKNGSYRAELIHTERGPTYLIERASLLTNLNTNTLPNASQELVSHQAMDFVQELLRPFVSELGEVREELGAERARREMAEATLREGIAEAERTLHERMAEAERALREGMVEAEHTLREGMVEERRRREEAERERDELRRELYALREPRESPETVEASEGTEPRSYAPGTQEGVQRPQGGGLRGLRRRLLGW